jgi:hypothetical protein
MTGTAAMSLLDIATRLRHVRAALRGTLPYANRQRLAAELRDLESARDARMARIAFAEWSDADLWRHLTLNARTTGAARILGMAPPAPYGRHVQLLTLELGRREAITRHGLTESATEA